VCFLSRLAICGRLLTTTSRSVPVSILLNHATQTATQPRFLENGREYYANWANTYPYPCDDVENDRLDCQHHAWYHIALGGRYHLATLRNVPGLRILDVGYGTGIWAMDVKNEYPNAIITAIDIGDAQPAMNREGQPVDYGVDFRSGVDFTLDDWGLQDGTFDFIHCAMLCGSVPDWQIFVSRVTR